MEATLDGKNFNRLIDAVRNFTSKNDAKPENCMIQLHFHTDGTNVEAYALDGYKAAKECAKCCTVDEDFVALISAPPIKANGIPVVEVSLEDDYAYISYGDIRFRTRQPNAEPFDVQKVIDNAMHKESTMWFGANVNYLLDALKSLKGSCAAGRIPVIVEFRGPNEPIIFRTDEDNPKMVMPIRIRDKEAHP